MDKTKLKKIALIAGIIALVLTLIVVVLALGGGNKSGGNANIVYWGLWEPVEVMQPLISEYEAEHPGVTIQYVQKRLGSQNGLAYDGTYREAVEERLMRSGGVDIMRVNYSWVLKYFKYLAPAPKKVLNAEEMRKDYYPALVDSLTSGDGSVFAMPLYIDGLVLFYNKTLLQDAGYSSPPQTWDDLIGYAKTLTKRDANGYVIQAGIAMGTGGNIAHAPDIVLLMLTQAGISVVDLQNKTFNISSPEAKAAVDYYLSFAEQGIWNYQLPLDLTMFVQGKLAMMIAPSWRVNDIVAMNNSLEFDTAPVPVIAGANSATPQYLANYWVEVVPKNSKHAKAAWEFLNWLSQPEQLRKLYELETKLRPMGEPYPRISMAGELADAPYAGAVIQMAPNMKAWPLYDMGLWENEFKIKLPLIESGALDSQTMLNQINEDLNNLIFNAEK